MVFALQILEHDLLPRHLAEKRSELPCHQVPLPRLQAPLPPEQEEVVETKCC